MNNIFDEMIELNNKFKTLLEEKFGVVYIVYSNEIVKNGGNETENEIDYLKLFVIPKSSRSIFLKINSIDNFIECKNEMKQFYDDFDEEFGNYFKKVVEQLDEKTKQSFEIIFRTIKNRRKKFNTHIEKFQIDDDWNISMIRKEFFIHIQKNLNDIIETLMNTISNGIKENSAYQGVLKIVNNFLENFGIYTEEVSVGEKCDYNILNPQDCDDCDTTDTTKKDLIKEVISLPYLLNEDEPKVVTEGKVILWRINYNG